MPKRSPHRLLCGSLRPHPRLARAEVSPCHSRPFNPKDSRSPLSSRRRPGAAGSEAQPSRSFPRATMSANPRFRGCAHERRHPASHRPSRMITPDISLNGKQRFGLSRRRTLIDILGSRASPGSCTIASPPACSTAISPFVPSLPPPVSMIPITREPYMLAADRKSGSTAGLV